MADARSVPRKMADAWKKSIGDRDPLGALVATRSLRADLAAWEDALVDEAVAAGMTWEAIGDALGITRQAGLCEWPFLGAGSGFPTGLINPDQRVVELLLGRGQVGHRSGR